MAVAERLRCPTTGGNCSYRTHLFDLHTPGGIVNNLSAGHVSSTTPIDLPSGFNSTTDEIKLSIRLFEHATAAKTLKCAGEDADGSCPTAEYMANNAPRRATKSVVRTVLDLVRGTN